MSGLSSSVSRTAARSAGHVCCRWPAVMTVFVTALMTFLAVIPAAEANEPPARYMQRVAKELVAAARSGSQSAFAETLRRHADVTSIGLYSLGSYVNRLPQAERPPYYSGMVNFIARYAAKEAPKYPVASAVVTGQTEETKSGVYVDSKVTLTNGTSYDVRWLLVRRGGAYKIRDAEVLGFWMSPFLKNLFEKYIDENGGNPRALVVALTR